MKKKFLFLLSILFCVPGIVSAASANVSVDAPSSVYVGDTVRINVTVSSGSSLGNWNYTIGYDDSKLEFVSTDADTSQSVFGEASNGGQTSATNSWVFRAKSSGSASFSVSSISVVSWDDFSEMKIGGSTSTSITVKNPSSNNNNSSNNNTNIGSHNDYKYSDDNNLSSLSIEGFSIDFDSSVTEYSLAVPNDIKKVKIGASASSGKASVSGIGDYDLKEGDNEIKIVVTAENGDTKTYKINVVVKELDPIEVKVGDKSYFVMRKADKLPKVNSTYKEGSILIKGESVPCYHSDITDIYLVGLVDEKGKLELYNYDSKNDKFYIYNEINIGGLYISLIDNKNAPSGYKSGLVKIGDREYNGFLKDGSYSLLYGVNLETGEKNFYAYDPSESTIQKYLVSSEHSNCNSKLIIYCLVGLCVFEFIMIIASVVSKNKQLKRILRDKLDVKTDYEKSLDFSSSSDFSISSENDNDSNDSEDSKDDMESDSDSSFDNFNEESQLNDISDDQYASQDSNSGDVSNSDVSFDTKEIENELGHTALISKSVTNVYNNTKNRKESIKERKALRKKKKKNKVDDDMFKF